MKFKIFGERNTGTRALKALIELNLGGDVLPSTEQELAPERCPGVEKDEAAMDALFAGMPAALSWKHCATLFEDVESLDGVTVLITVKHPLAWLVSFFDRPYHWRKAETVAEFAAQPWPTVQRERLGGQAFTPLELYRAKMGSYLDLADKVKTAFVRSEDIVLSPEKTLRKLGLEGEFRPLQQSTKDKAKTVADYAAYYGEERWRSRLEGVAETPDWEQVASFGYR